MSEKALHGASPAYCIVNLFWPQKCATGFDSTDPGLKVYPIYAKQLFTIISIIRFLNQFDSDVCEYMCEQVRRVCCVPSWAER